MKFCVLGSGSRGNSAWFQADNGPAVLIDAGLSARQMGIRMSQRGLLPVATIFLTHGHRDHIAGTPQFASSATMLYGSAPTLKVAYFNPCCVPTRVLKPRETIEMHDVVGRPNLHVTGIPVIHNIPMPFAYLLVDGTSSLLFIGETGRVTAELRALLPKVDALLIEANHDPNMVVANEVLPDFVKQRILANHLSNDAAAAAIRELTPAPNGSKIVVLLHLSQQNNDPELARKICEPMLPPGWRLVVSNQQEPTEVLEV